MVVGASEDVSDFRTDQLLHPSAETAGVLVAKIVVDNEHFPLVGRDLFASWETKVLVHIEFVLNLVASQFPVSSVVSILLIL